MDTKKIILVTLSPKTHRTSEENLGLEYLKSCLVEKNYDVKIIDAWLNELDVKTVYDEIMQDKDNILFVGISSYMSNTKPTLELIEMLKSTDENIKVACGGFGPTFYPAEYLNNGADFVMRGEGEDVICMLADALNYNKSFEKINSIGYKKREDIILNPMLPLREDLDALPFPSRDTMEVVRKNKSTVNMVTSRGCSGNCEFCSVISFFRLSNGKIWRTRSINNIVDEIEQLYKQGITHIKMVDDSFIDGIRDENWCKEFADEIEKRDIHVRLRGQIRADKVTDGILEHLKRAGFFSFACGIENGSETALKRMSKMANVSDNKRALQLFKKHGYIVQMGYILFDKYTTFEELEENYKFMEENAFAVTKGIFSEMFSAEGTKLNDTLRKNGELIESNFVDNNNKYTIRDIHVENIYKALKTWHKSHSKVYDMTIDPVIAPKAIDEDTMYEFYDYIMELKKEDLEFFKNVLIYSKEHPETELSQFVNNQIENSKEKYKTIEENIEKVYRKANLCYHADINPFI